MKGKGMLRSGIAALMLLLVASMSFAPAVSAAEVIGSVGGSGSENSCSACSCGANVTVVELNGSEANKAIAEALKNEEVKELRRELIERGYTPKRSDAIAAYRVTVDSGTVMQEALMVTIPFNTHGEEVNASIVWMKYLDHETVEGVIKGSVIESEFREAMDILKNNIAYQEAVINLTINGYNVKESEGQVVETLTTDSEIAMIAIPAYKDNHTESIIGMVDLNRREVLAVIDFDCYETCKTVCKDLIIGYGCWAICNILLDPETAGLGSVACTIFCGAIADVIDSWTGGSDQRICPDVCNWICSWW